MKQFISDFDEIFESTSEYVSFNNKTVCVTGAYGMLGRYLTYYLCYLNEHHGSNICIVAIGRNENKMDKFFHGFMQKEYFVPIIGDLSETLDFENKIDYIFHTASLASGQYYQTNPVDVISANTIGTYNLLEFARRCQSTGFLYVSSGAVYGDIGGEIPVPETTFGPLDPLNARACYAESKRLGETLCKAYHMQFQIDTKIIRLGHTYGPTLDIKNDKRVFSEFISDILEGKDIQILSDGSSKRPFTYISDIIVAMMIVLFKGDNGEAYNACNNNCYVSVKELAEILTSLYPQKNLKAVCRFDQGRGFKESKSTGFTLDCNKIENLGWKPCIDILEGFNRTCERLEKYE